MPGGVGAPSSDWRDWWANAKMSIVSAHLQTRSKAERRRSVLKRETLREKETTVLSVLIRGRQLLERQAATASVSICQSFQSDFCTLMFLRVVISPSLLVSHRTAFQRIHTKHYPRTKTSLHAKRKRHLGTNAQQKIKGENSSAFNSARPIQEERVII